MNILVSGADGNLGSAVVDRLKSDGHGIYGLFGKKEKAQNPEEKFIKEWKKQTKHLEKLTEQF